MLLVRDSLIDLLFVKFGLLRRICRGFLRRNRGKDWVPSALILELPGFAQKPESYRSTDGWHCTPARAFASDLRIYSRLLSSLRTAMPRADSSVSNCDTAGETSPSPGTTTAHSRFSRNSFVRICHCSKESDLRSPISMMDQWRVSASAAASSGTGPLRIK